MKHRLFFLLIILFALQSLWAQSENEMGLAALLTMAGEKNRDIALAKLNQQKALYLVKTSYSSLYPSISLSSAYSRMKGKTTGYVNIEGIDFETESTYYNNNYSYGLNLNQWLFLPQDISDIMTIARSDTTIANLAQQQSMETAYYNIITSYFNYLKLKSLYNVALEEVSVTEDDMKRSQKMFDLGLLDKSTLLSARISYETSQYNSIQAENDMIQAKWQLCNLAGLDPARDYHISDDGIVFALQDMDFSRQAEYAKRHNLGFLLQQQQGERAEKTFRQAKHEYLPDLSISARAGYSDNELPIRDYAISGGVSLSFSLFEGFRTRYNVAMEKINMRQAVIETEKAKDDLVYTVKQLLLQIKALRDLLHLSQSTEEKAEQDLKLAKARFEAGLGIFLEVDDARVTYIKARSDRFSAFYNLKAAYANLLLLRGDLLDHVRGIAAP